MPKFRKKYNYKKMPTQTEGQTEELTEGWTDSIL